MAFAECGLVRIALLLLSLQNRLTSFVVVVSFVRLE